LSEHDDEPARLVPDEVRRLRLEPDDRLIVRTADTGLASEQISRYQERLQAAFPNNEVLIIVADEVLIERAIPAPQWITVDITRSTVMTDEELRRFTEKIVRHVRDGMQPPISERKDDDPDDGLAGVPARR
jgi:hypothetical protein